MTYNPNIYTTDGNNHLGHTCTDACRSKLSISCPLLDFGLIDFGTASAGNFVMAWCWEYARTRGILDERTRTLLDIVILVTTLKPAELEARVEQALEAGTPADEVKAVILHATTFAGIPAGLAAFSAVQGLLRRNTHKPKLRLGAEVSA